MTELRLAAGAGLSGEACLESRDSGRPIEEARESDLSLENEGVRE